MFFFSSSTKRSDNDIFEQQAKQRFSLSSDSSRTIAHNCLSLIRKLNYCIITSALHLNLINLCYVVSFSCSELETGGMLQGGKTVTVKDSSKEICQRLWLKNSKPDREGLSKVQSQSGIKRIRDLCHPSKDKLICSCSFFPCVSLIQWDQCEISNHHFTGILCESKSLKFSLNNYFQLFLS